MVEEDPNEEAYYEMGKTRTSSVPVSYANMTYTFMLYM